MTSNIDAIHVGITGLNSTENPAPGIGVAKSLRENIGSTTNIIGLALDGMESGVYMNSLFNEIYLIPYPSADPNYILSRLSYIKDKCQLNVIIPNLDSELLFYAKYKKSIEALGINLFIPTADQLRICNKTNLFNLACAIDVKLPKQTVLHSYEQLDAAIKKISMPLMIKGIHYNSYRANSYQETIFFLNKMISSFGWPIILQRVVGGNEINIIGVGDGTGQLLGFVSVKKVTTTVFGKIWTGMAIHNEKLTETAKKFVKHTKWQGPFEIECILQNDDVYLVEVNPRFPSWVYFATKLGINLPQIVLQKALGRTISDIPVTYPSGALFIRHIEESIYDINKLGTLATNGESNEYVA